MKTELTLLRNASALLVLLLSTLNPQLSTCFAQGAGFTYQGQLNQDGAPAEGTYDLRFTLYDSPSGDGVVAGPLTNSAVAVSNGLFTTLLDFGPGAFTGADRWLAIEAGVSGGAFTPLAPRQPLTPAPYAITAGNVAGVVSSGGLAGTYSGAVNFNNAANQFTGAFAGDGASVSNVNAATLGGLGAGGFWQLGGNAGSTPGTDFLGTTDETALEFKVNHQRALRLEPNASGAPNIIGGSPLNFVAPGVGGAAIGGGGGQSVQSAWSVIGGGEDNLIHPGSTHVTIAGGYANSVDASSWGSTISGGRNNEVQFNSFYDVIGGGSSNVVVRHSFYSTISGGQNNMIGTNSFHGVVAGGRENFLRGFYATIGGGLSNTNTGESAVISGGYLNQARARWSTVAGGVNNNAGADASTIAGGNGNRTEANDSAVGGGSDNVAAGFASAVPGGRLNEAAGSYSFAAGRRAKANHDGAFVLADAVNADFSSTTNNQFNVRAAGGVRIQSNPGIQLNSADTPLITRGWDQFGTNAPSHKQGHGRWGVFMEPFRLNIGIPSNDIPNRFFSVAKYDTNGNYVSLMQVDQEGVVSATEFVGTGSGLTGVNASQLGGLDATAFAPASHNHWGESWSGSLASQGGLTVRNSESVGSGTAGIIGRQGAGAGVFIGTAAGVWGDSETGLGVLATTSDASSTARGVFGISWATAGSGTGVSGLSNGATGYGTRGIAASQAGASVGVYGETASTNGGSAVLATAHGASGTTYAVRGIVSSTSGYAAYFTGPIGSRNYFQRNVGIGTAAPNFLLHLGSDSAAKPTSSSWTISSDERLKKNVTPLEGSLDRLLQLRGVSYQWIDPASQGDMDGTYTGLIAQEVEPVFPEWIRTGADGYKTLTVIGFEALTVESLRELRAEIQRRDAENAELASRVQELEKLVRTLLQTAEAMRDNDTDNLKAGHQQPCDVATLH